MQVRISRKFPGPQQFSMIEFEATATTDDLPLLDNETPGHWISRATHEIYKHVVGWEVYHGKRTREEAVVELRRHKKFLGLDSIQPKPDEEVTVINGTAVNEMIKGHGLEIKLQ